MRSKGIWRCRRLLAEETSHHGAQRVRRWECVGVEQRGESSRSEGWCPGEIPGFPPVSACLGLSE